MSRVDRVVRDDHLTIEAIVRVLDNGLDAETNFAPAGIAGEVLTSNGPNTPPSFQAGNGTGNGTTSTPVSGFTQADADARYYLQAQVNAITAASERHYRFVAG